MSNANTTHHSYWLSTSGLRRKFEPVRGDVKTEIAILGAGITGLSTALELLQRGYKVAVIEALTIGAGTTGGSTGHLDAHPEAGPSKLVSHLGLEKVRSMVTARQRAIDLIEQRSTPECDFRRIPAYRFSDNPVVKENQAGDPPPQLQSARDLEADMQAAADAGLSVQWTQTTPVPRGGFGYRVEGMARLNCLTYLHHLANLVVERGGTIYEQSLASGPVESKPTHLKVTGGAIHFDHVVCAVHCNYSDVMRTYLQTPAYQSYVVAVRVENPPPDALYWDSTDPYYYTRRANSADPKLIIVGGCDKRTGAHKSDEVAAALLEYVRARYQVTEVVAQWSAELFEPVDGIPIIGRLPGKENVWVATGLSGVGLTWGTAAGTLLAEQISGNETPLDELLSPKRFALDSLGTMISEQTTATIDLLRRVLPAHRFDASKLQTGEGQVGVDDHEHVAACRDAQGCLHRHNPICPHMGGVVQWNAAEQTWDCPVHGGRFTAQGKRIYGPPEGDLAAPGEKAKDEEPVVE